MGNIRIPFLAGHSSRNIAFLVLIAVPVGNLLCESGNLLAVWLGFASHYFNQWFLVIGIVGVIGFGIALFGRRGVGNNTFVE